MSGSKSRYYVRPGDLLHNPSNGVFGVITKITKEYIHFMVVTPHEDQDSLFEKAPKSEVYYHVDEGELEVHYGSQKRRRPRPHQR